MTTTLSSFSAADTTTAPTTTTATAMIADGSSSSSSSSSSSCILRCPPLVVEHKDSEPARCETIDLVTLHQQSKRRPVVVVVSHNDNAETTAAPGSATVIPNQNHDDTTHDNTDNNNCSTSADEECVRILTRQLRQSMSTATPSLTEDDDNWRERFVLAASGSGAPAQWFALHNVVGQLQHAVTLAQHEAAVAVDDAATAQRDVQQWQQACQSAVQHAAVVQARNQVLVRRTKRWCRERQILKAAYRTLAVQQRQQVECYVTSALVTHEQHLNNGNHISKHKTNRSRTATETTLESSTSYPNIISSSTSATTSPRLQEDHPVMVTIVCRNEKEKVATVPTQVIEPVAREPFQNVGFGASGALGFGKTFQLKPLPTPLAVETKKAEASSAKKGLYTPVLLDCAVATTTSGQSYDNHDDSVGSPKIIKNYFFQSPSDVNKRQAPLISINAINEAAATREEPTLPENGSSMEGPEDSIGSSSCLASPTLFASPHSLDDMDSDSPPSLWNVQVRRCDPHVLRSLSIPVVYDEGAATPFSAQPEHSTTSTQKMLELRAHTYN